MNPWDMVIFSDKQEESWDNQGTTRENPSFWWIDGLNRLVDWVERQFDELERHFDELERQFVG